MPASARYREIASALRLEIEAGTYPPRAMLPSNAELATRLQASRVTVRHAIEVLEADGLVRAIQGRGTEVVDRRAVPVRLSQYPAVLVPGGGRGPWETACALAGIRGDMEMVDAEQAASSADVAEALGLPIGSRVMRRDRRAKLDGATAQLQTAWYPLDVVQGTPLATAGKVVGGAYAALIAAGVGLTSMDVMVSARGASPEEAAELRVRGGAPVLVVERLTRAGNRVVELLRTIAQPSGTVLVFDGLPIG